MKYAEFRSKVVAYPYFRSNIFKHLVPNPALLRRQIVDWVKKNYIIELKRGVYTLNSNDRQVSLTPLFLSQALYSPSYISLESALSYYQMIPERIEAITAVTTKKTFRLYNQLGHFIYRHIKTSCFTGFIEQKDEFGNSFLIATPEKALLDFFYYKTHGMRNITQDLFEESFRLQNLDQLNFKNLKAMALLFNQKKIIQCVNLLTKKEYRRDRNITKKNSEI